MIKCSLLSLRCIPFRDCDLTTFGLNYFAPLFGCPENVKNEIRFSGLFVLFWNREVTQIILSLSFPKIIVTVKVKASNQKEYYIYILIDS